MENNLHTPESTVLEKINFCIPLYQRPYAWEEKQVTTLLEDLYETYKEKNSEKYYIGILSVATKLDAFPYDLVDGQQRITTLTLIGMAASEYFNDWNSFLSEEKLDLYGRVDDKDFLKNQKNDKANPRLKKGLECAKTFFSHELTDEIDREHFAEFIYKNASFFLSQIPSEYTVSDRNLHFVRMNNRGDQLEPHEILKIKLLNPVLVPDQKTREDYLNTWNEMVSCLTGSGIYSDDLFKLKLADILNPQIMLENKKSISIVPYTSIIDVSEFLLMVLARCKFLELNVSHKKDKLIEIFEGSQITNDKVSVFMSKLSLQIESLKRFFIFYSRNEKNGKYELGVTEKSQNEKDPEFIYPEDRKERSEIDDGLIAVQSFLYISTEAHHWLIPAFDYLENLNNSKIDAKLFFDELESIDKNLTKKAIRQASVLPSLADMNYTNKFHSYWFYRLDYELWKESIKPIDQDNIWFNFKTNHKDEVNILMGFKFRPCESVEHINPQKPQENDVALKVDDFGNLALISSSINSKFGNNNPDGKKGSIKANGKTESLKMLHFLFGGQTYGDEYIEAEGKLMYDLLSKAVKDSQPATEATHQVVALDEGAA